MRRLLHALAIVGAGCGDAPLAQDTSPTGGSVATVTFAYRAPTRPTLPASLGACVDGVGPTHIHASWHDYRLTPMRVVDAERFELTYTDVPAGQRVQIRVSDANACLENPTGAATRNVSANGVLLSQVVPTPGSGIEPGLALTVAADGTVTP